MAKKLPPNEPKTGQEQPNRRQALKAVLTGGGVIATALSLPKEWTKPIVESVVVPAHAQLSPTTTGTLPPPPP